MMPEYNTAIQIDAQNLHDEVDRLIKAQKCVKVTVKKNKRSLSQNNYFYFLCDYFAVRNGFTVVEVKHMIKEELRPIFYYNKLGYEFPRSMADLDSREKSEVISFFKLYSDVHYDLRLPDATYSAENLASLEVENYKLGLEQQKYV